MLLDADKLSYVVAECLQSVVQAASPDSVVSLAVETNESAEMLIVSAKLESPCAIHFSPSAVFTANLKRLRGILESVQGGLVLYLPITQQTDRHAVARHVSKDTVRLSVVVCDADPVSLTMTRNVLWERNHLVTFVHSVIKLSDMLEGLDVLVLRCIGDVSAGEVQRVQTVRPTLCIIAMVGAEVQLSPSKYVIVVQYPTTLSNLHAAVDQAVAVVEEKRDAERKLTELRAILSTAKTCPWKRGKMLGRGAFATVYEATNEITNGKMAVRVVSLDVSDPDERKLRTNALLEEIRMMSSLEHPNIISYLYCERSGSDVNIFMEYAPGGSLRSLLEKKGPASVSQVVSWLSDILAGLSYLHEKGVVHCDIKCANILLSQSGACKLSDFGTSKSFEGQKPTMADGTLQFMAPEVLNNQPYDWRADIWSLGCTVMEMLTGLLPFSHLVENPLAYVSLITSFGRDTPITLPNRITDANAISFIKECLSVNPALRPDCATLRSHPFLTTPQEDNRKASATLDFSPRRVKAGQPPPSNFGGIDSEDEDDRRGSCFGNWSATANR